MMDWAVPRSMLIWCSWQGRRCVLRGAALVENGFGISGRLRGAVTYELAGGQERLVSNVGDIGR